jgi:hypothetical protein
MTNSRGKFETKSIEIRGSIKKKVKKGNLITHCLKKSRI